MRYVLRKLTSTLLTIILVALITFLVFQILPGDPALVMLGPDADPAQVAQLHQSMGLDGNTALRFFKWLKAAAKGDFGTSYRYGLPISSLIWNAFSVSLSIGLLGLGLSVLIGIPLGVLLASRKSHGKGMVLTFLSQMGLSVPAFLVGILLISLLAVRIPLFPSMGYVRFSQSHSRWFASIFLPSLSLAIGCASVLSQYLSSSILEQQKKDYVRTVRSEGAGESRILYLHVLRNSLVPVVTIFGMLVADVLGGSIIIENVFSLPGIGKLLTSSITSRDLPLLQALVLYLSFIVIVCNFAVDVVYRLIDPRIRLE
ncbi:MAG: ABC transporter permease [Spirochaetia bacterium]|jgi:peptide/nickel transport system permease protein|nr:ABC transporter permease [Spirochaetia bacterium]